MEDLLSEAAQLRLAGHVGDEEIHLATDSPDLAGGGLGAAAVATGDGYMCAHPGQA
jgi:hypothetical protein